MLVLGCYIKFETSDGKKYLELLNVNAVEINSSWKNLTDTCKITLPRRMKVSENGKAADILSVIKRGSKVLVYLGYDGDLSLEFVGYVVRFSADVPFTIECEDEMWQLKQNNINKSFRAVNMKTLVSEVWKGKSNVLDFDFGSYRINNASSAKFLDDLKQYNIVSYFTFDQEGLPTLNVGLGGYDFRKIAVKHIYNMMINVVENNLIFKTKDESKIKVVVTSTAKGGVVISTEVGDFDGELKEVKLPPDISKSALDRVANAELEKTKYDGYRGTITGFGQPKARHNDVAIIQSPEYTEREGSYLIDAVKITFGMDGFRRELELGIKVN